MARLLIVSLLAASSLVTCGCSSSSSGGKSKNGISCESNGIGTGCDVDCAGNVASWSFSCASPTGSGLMSCSCTAGPKKGFLFEEPSVCDIDSKFNGEQECGP